MVRFSLLHIVSHVACEMRGRTGLVFGYGAARGQRNCKSVNVNVLGCLVGISLGCFGFGRGNALLLFIHGIAK